MSAGKAFWTTWKPFGLAWLLTLVLAPAVTVLRHMGRNDTVRIAPFLLTFPISVSLAAAQRYADEWLPWGWVMLFQFPAYALLAWAAARRNRLKTAALAIAFVHLVAVVLGSPWSWGPSLGDFSSRLRERAGADVRGCGIVAFGEPHATAVACARDALASGAAFSVGFQEQGIDSTIYVGLARPAGGDVVAVHWDSDASGGGNLVPLSNLYERSCPHPSIQEERGRPGIECDPVAE